jgi:hypothetical protein
MKNGEVRFKLVIKHLFAEIKTQQNLKKKSKAIHVTGRGSP